MAKNGQAEPSTNLEKLLRLDQNPSLVHDDGDDPKDDRDRRWNAEFDHQITDSTQGEAGPWASHDGRTDTHGTISSHGGDVVV